MAHWTIELARACISGDEIVGPWKNEKGVWEVVSAYPAESVLTWRDETGNSGSVVLYLMPLSSARKEHRLFYDLALQGWVPAGDDVGKVKRQMRARIRENLKWAAKLEKKK